MPTEDEYPSPPDIATMLTDQTSACKAAREAIAAGGEVQVFDELAPHLHRRHEAEKVVEAWCAEDHRP